MKAQELMLGDYVTLSANTNVRMQVISNMPLINIIGLADIDNHGAIEEYPTEALCGIPLTPEILEKNGFRYGITETEEFQLRNAGVSCCCQNGYVYEDISGTIKIIFPGETNGGQIEIYDTKFDKSLCLVWNKDLAVHELQHALWLCGIDKKIIL